MVTLTTFIVTSNQIICFFAKFKLTSDKLKVYNFEMVKIVVGII